MHCIINCCERIFYVIGLHAISCFGLVLELKICFYNKSKTLLVSVVALSVFSKRMPFWQSCVSFLSSGPWVWNRTPLHSLCLCVGSSCVLGSGGAILMSWALCEPPGALPVWHWMGILCPELHRLCSAATATTHAPAPGKGWWSQTAAEDEAQDLGLSAGQNRAVWSETPGGDRILQEGKLWLHWFQCNRAACFQIKTVLGTLNNINTETVSWKNIKISKCWYAITKGTGKSTVVILLRL